MAQSRGMDKPSEPQRKARNKRQTAIAEESPRYGARPSDAVHRRARAIAGGLFKRNKAVLEAKRHKP